MQSAALDDGRQWKLALAVLMASSLIGLGATWMIAAQHVAPVTDPDYYRHGLLYGKTDRGLKNPGLQWTISPSLSKGDLLVRVTDPDGVPVGNGTLRFETKRGGIESPKTLMLSEQSPGVFRAPRPISPDGELHGMLHFSRGDGTATRKVVLFN
jgi:hypothetical protein